MAEKVLGPNGLLPYKSYETSLEDLPAFLAEHGVAVLPALLSPDELVGMEKSMWALLRALTARSDAPISRSKPATWASLDELHPMHGMLLQDHVGHSTLAWMARQHPRVAQAFARIWACAPEDLVTSFDGMSIHLAPELQPDPESAGWHEDSDWFHVDQAYARPGFECVQGLVTAFDVHDGDASLAILEGSHKMGPDLCAAFPKYQHRESDWCRLGRDQLDFLLQHGCQRFNVKCPAGSLVLWDSRTVHCGCLPQRGRPQPSTRCVVYVCQWPRTKLDHADLERKQTHFTQRAMTSHWPDGRTVFGREAGPKLPRAELTALGRRLAGFDD